MMDGGGSGGSPDDALLSRLYQQVTEAQGSQFAAGYDHEAGLNRYQAWLREHSEVDSDSLAPADAVTPDAFPATEPSQPSEPATSAEPSEPAASAEPREPAASAEPSEPAASAEPSEPAASAEPSEPTEPSEWSADLAVIELYSMHYKALVRLAAMLVRDRPTAEEVVQEAFIAMHDGWGRLREADKALAYMRQAVVNRSRSVLRHRMVVEKNQQKPPPDMPSAEHGALTLLERSAVVAALRDLPERQREAIVLRYYADLSEAEIAAAMKISRGAVKSHTSRGMAALRAALEYDV